MKYEETDYLLLSGIQHYAFCPRQWALIHMEGQWSENYLTASGRIMHMKAHSGEITEKRGDLIITRALKVSSSRLGVSGECDVVEFRKSPGGIPLNGFPGRWTPYPVEYKRGKMKPDNCDRLQLCAQAMCLEEMLCVKIKSGALFYGEHRKRETVVFTPELRGELMDIVISMHKLFRRRVMPKATKTKQCKGCSMKDLCLPSLGGMDKTSVRKYMETHLE